MTDKYQELIDKYTINDELNFADADNDDFILIKEYLAYYGIHDDNDEIEALISEQRKHTDKTKVKMSKAKKGELNGMFNKKHTVEAKKKMRLAKLPKLPIEEFAMAVAPIFYKRHQKDWDIRLNMEQVVNIIFIVYRDELEHLYDDYKDNNKKIDSLIKEAFNE